MGYSKILVQLKSRDSANSLINNPVLKVKNFVAYIPTFNVSRQGIIRNVSLDISEEEFIRELESPFELAAYRRLNRKNPNIISPDTPNYIPSKTLTLTFRGQSLPKYIFLYHVRYEVSPFVPRVTFCTRCLRIGHVKSQCKGFPRCAHCTSKAHEDNSDCPDNKLPPTCANCKGAHLSSDPRCPELLSHKQVRNLAASKNIPFAEAKRIIRNNNGHVVHNPQFDFSNFPELNDSPTPFFSPLLPLVPPVFLVLSPTLIQ